MRIKENSIPLYRAGPRCACSYRKFSSYLSGIPAKTKLDPTLPGWFTSHINILCFYKSILKNVRSFLGEPAHLIGPVHLHMNNSLQLKWKICAIGLVKTACILIFLIATVNTKRTKASRKIHIFEFTLT